MLSSCKFATNSMPTDEDELDASFLRASLVASLHKGLLLLEAAAEGDSSPTEESTAGANGSVGT
jgi:hypothetical protein